MAWTQSKHTTSDGPAPPPESIRNRPTTGSPVGDPKLLDVKVNPIPAT